MTGDIKMSNLAEKLLDLAINGKDWEKWPTELSGVFLVRPPPRKNQEPSLMVAINPVNESGSPRKKKNYFIKNRQELLELKEILNDEKLDMLFETLEETFPSGKKEKESSEVIRI